MAEGGCCTTAAALIGYKRPISWLRYKTKKVEPKVQSPAQCSYERLAALAASPSIKRGHKPRAADGVRPWPDVAVVVYAPRPTWCRKPTGWRIGGYGVGGDVRLPESKWRRLTVSRILESSPCFFANLAPSRLVLEETACSNSNRASVVGFW